MGAQCQSRSNGHLPFRLPGSRTLRLFPPSENFLSPPLPPTCIVLVPMVASLTSQPSGSIPGFHQTQPELTMVIGSLPQVRPS